VTIDNEECFALYKSSQILSRSVYVRVRAHISVLTTPSDELLQLLTELNGWLQEISDEISGSAVLAGDTAMLAVQYEHSQVSHDRPAEAGKP